MALTLPSAGAGPNALALDIRALNALKQDVGNPAARTTREAARQFESLFMRELVKSMRAATLQSGLLQGGAADLGQDLLDQQLALSMSGLPGGLSEAITRQLERQMGATGAPSSPGPATLYLQAPTTPPAAALPPGRNDFVQRLGHIAQRVARDSGIPASFLLGQAGHETGWGRREIKTADGANTFNLFGIKAGQDWTGKVAQTSTTEYLADTPHKVLARFRAYDSYEESFRDYARLINHSPRYAQARVQIGSPMAYAAALQKAGYATDPDYARKLGDAIHSAGRVRRA